MNVDVTALWVRQRLVIKRTGVRRVSLFGQGYPSGVIALLQVTRCSRSPNQNTPADGPAYTKYLCKDEVGVEGNLDFPMQVRGDPGEGNYKL